MEQALYHPAGGYYVRPGVQRVGRGGDFITSVSIGPVFGMLLAERVSQAWRQNGAPPQFALVEPGPETGLLAGDLTGSLATRDPECLAALHYHLIEPVPEKHEVLRDRLAELPGVTSTVCTSAREIAAPLGIIIANEILDALPVHLVEKQNGRWLERHVSANDNGFTWATLPCEDDAVLAALEPWQDDLPDGYTTEVCLDYEAFLQPFADAFERAVFVLIDYGFSSADYYQPARTEGTLQVYQSHRKSDDPLAAPGEADITTHVDFSRVLSAAEKMGLHGHGFYRQEQYLTPLAAPLLTAPDSPFATDPALIRQFRTLTHPALPGGRFSVLELTKGPVHLDPFPFSGLSYLRE